MLVGANPDELDALAKHMERAADKLARVHTDALGLIHHSAWTGPNAEEYERRWRQDGRARITGAADILRAASASLRRNASEQRKASAAEGGSFVGVQTVTAGAAPSGTDAEWARGAGSEQLAQMAKRSPEEQLAWWNTLTPEQQAALIVFNPIGILALQGLPSDVREEANREAAERLRPTIAVEKTAENAELSVNVKLIKVGVDTTAEITKFADGHVEVKILGGVAGGVGVSNDAASASRTVKGEGSLSYSFQNQEEADRFLKGLLEAPLPDSAGDVAAIVVGATAPGLAAYVGTEVKDYLEGYQSDLVSSKVGVSMNSDLSVKIDGAGSVSLHGAEGAEYDFTKHETTAFVEVDGAVAGACGPFAGAAGADGRVEVTWGDDGSIKAMSFKGDYSAQVGTGLSGPITLSSLEGTSGSYEVSVDLSDPANQRMALDMLRGAAVGDSGAVAAAFHGLRDSSQVIVQANHVISDSGGVDIKAAGITVSSTTTTNDSTWVKPPHGQFTELAAGGSSGGW